MLVMRGGICRALASHQFNEIALHEADIDQVQAPISHHASTRHHVADDHIRARIRRIASASPAAQSALAEAQAKAPFGP